MSRRHTPRHMLPRRCATLSAACRQLRYYFYAAKMPPILRLLLMFSPRCRLLDAMPRYADADMRYI